ncbi:type III secretion protein [Yersinia pseudotuberculosis]|uniref:Type III secretion system apparatus protein n=1 Tax=Yersinia pseudotuberculosis TaxID=633 RepID=A0A380QDU7_YERPU|nr:type III secretion protein [Yersinia pseudotuberculosis]PSH21992.1 type III secretion protein [Yersinia pseudotuberculosis]SUP86537.1 type III secretion system apparatus protein [Yersinia pseudotuberculosis]
MNHSQQRTLQRLLALRQRQERRLRQQLGQLRREQQQQEQQLENGRRRHQQLCQQLQQLAQWCGMLTPLEADEQKVLRQAVYQAERQAQKQLNAWVAQGRQQISAIERQQARLRRNQREQEKLRMLTEDESNRY